MSARRRRICYGPGRSSRPPWRPGAGRERDQVGGRFAVVDPRSGLSPSKWNEVRLARRALPPRAGRATAAGPPGAAAASRSAAGGRRTPPRAPRRPGGRRAARRTSAARSRRTRSPHDGVNGLRSTHQTRGSRSAPSPTPNRLALEAVGALDEPVVDRDRQPEPRGDRRRGLLGPLQRAGHDVRCRGRRAPRPPASAICAPEVGEVEAGQPAVEDAAPGCAPRRAAAGARRSWSSRSASCRPRPRPWPPRGRAAAIWSSAPSSSAVETNHASKALGGR